MPETDHATNPFPGLRPFESNETHLFFGRDGQSEELLRRLKRTRFLAVVGTSGSGKSSLVRAGLLPALQGGLMASAGSDWRIAILRPGSDPIGNLARALAAPAVLGPRDEKGQYIQTVMTETTLRKSSLGVVELVRRARTRLDDHGQPLFPDYENLLVVVDQFEELFRFKQLIAEENSQEDAAAFVKLLLEAVGPKAEKIYVVLTMRSDFLGDCSQFWELPEAINNGQYLIPRMTRDERREAISGPVAVGQGAISEPLVSQLLNDVGDNPDQLPIMQHALMRTWDYWMGHRRNGNPIDIPDYNAIGGMAEALSRHADEAYAELDDKQKAIAERLFKGLTEKGTDNREIRRPMEVGEICELTGASEAAVIAVVEVFRGEGRSFLMPPPTDAVTGARVHLNRESLIDISHESLIRNWDRLKTWVDEESRSARIYRRLAETAVLHKEGGAGLWGDPDLGVALTWREQSNPNQVWAKRYHPEFPLAMNFMAESVTSRDALIAGEEARRRREIRRTRLTALIFAVAFLFSLAMGVYAYGQKNMAQSALGEAKAERDKAQAAQKEADQRAKEARTSAGEAEAQSKLADDAKQRAEEAKQRAEEAKQRAESDRLRAVTAEKTAAERAIEAEKQRELAKEQTSIAELNEYEAQKASHEAHANEEVARANFKEAIKEMAKSRKLLYSSTIGVAQKAVEDSNSERAQKLLHDLIPTGTEYSRLTMTSTRGSGEWLTPADFPTDLRGFEWYYMWRLASRKLATYKLGEAASSKAETTPQPEHNADPVAVYTARPVAPVAFGSEFREQLVAVGNDNIVKMWIGLSSNPEFKLPAQTEAVKAVALMGLYQFITADRTAIKVWSLPNPDPDAPPEKGIHLARTAKLKGNDAHIALDVVTGKNLVAVGSGSTFLLWNIREEKPVTLAEGDIGYPSVRFVDKGETLITSDGSKLTRWNVKTKESSEIRLLRKDNEVGKKLFIKSFAFTPDGKKMVTSSNQNFMVWEAANAEGTAYSLQTELQSHRENYFNRNPFKDLVVAISPDGKLLATGDGTDLTNGGGVKVWDITGNKPKEWVTLSPDVASATSLDFSSDSRTLAVGSGDALQLWDVSQIAPWRSPQPYELGNLPATLRQDASPNFALSPDGQLEAVSGSPSEVGWWNPKSDPSTKPGLTTVGDVSTQAMAFSPDGKLLAVGGGGSEADNGVVILWNTQSRERIKANIKGHRGVGINVLALDFSPDSRILATGADDKTIELWDVSTTPAKLLAPPLEGHKFHVTSVAYSPDGKTIASGDESGTVNLWSASSYQLLLTLKASDDPIVSVAFSKSSDNLYTRDRKGEIRLWPATPRGQVDQLLQKTSFFAPPFKLDNLSQVGAKYSSLREPFARPSKTSKWIWESRL